MIETYKILKEIYDPEVSPGLPRNLNITRGHSFKLAKPRAIGRTRQHFFTNRIVNTWNSLPDHIVTAPSVKAFERRLDKHWRDQDIKYDFESLLDVRSQPTVNLYEDEDLDI